MPLNLKKHLDNLGLLTELNNWYQVYLQGDPRRQIRPTDEQLLQYVKNLLAVGYQDESGETFNRKVDNNPLAPWLIKIALSFGSLGEVGTVDRERMLTVIRWFRSSKSGGNIRKIENLDLGKGHQIADKDLEELETKLKQTEKRVKERGEEKEKYATPETADEVANKIKRIYDLPDGSGRFWAKVIKPEWFQEKCEAGKTKGIECQSWMNPEGKYAKPPNESYSLIGPLKGDPTGPISTLGSIAIINTSENSWAVAEYKQEGNQYPGAQATSGGWTDLAEWFAGFVAYNPVMKKIEYFGSDSGQVEEVGGGQHGGTASLVYMMKNQSSIFNRLADARPDVVRNNKELIVNSLGEDWFVKRSVDIISLAKKNPEEFLSQFEFYQKIFGDKVKEGLKEIDFKKISPAKSRLMFNILPTLIDYITPDKFNEIIRRADFPDFIEVFINVFVELIRKMINNKQYGLKEVEPLLNNFSKQVINAYGGGGKGLDGFLRVVSRPRLEQHQNAKFDGKNNVYIGTRTEPIFDANGRRTGSDEVEFEISDDLKILPQKERRRFIQNNKEYIKSFFKGNDEDKEVAYLRFFVREASEQEARKQAQAAKEKIIDYYDKKYQNNESQFPGIVEYYTVLNKHARGYGYPSKHGIWKGEEIRPLIFPMEKEDVKKYRNNIIKYYRNLSLAEEPIRKVYDGILGYLETMEGSGFDSSEIANQILEKFSPQKLVKQPKIADYAHYFSIVKKAGVDNRRIIDYIKSQKENIIAASEDLGSNYYNDFLQRYSVIKEDIKIRKYIRKRLYEKFGNEEPKKKSISYSAIVLDDKSRKLLLSKFKQLGIPKDWEPSAHHMTIKMGELEDKSFIDKKIKLKVMSFGIDDKVAAVGVQSPIEPEDRKAHITLALNRQAGGTPKISKELERWRPLGRPFYITGRLQQVPEQF